MSRVTNSMERKLGQSFQLSEVRNKSELLQRLANCRISKEPPYRGLQKYKSAHGACVIGAIVRFIVTLVEGYIPVVISLKQNNCDIIKNRDICLTIYRGWKQLISPKPTPFPWSLQNPSVHFWKHALIFKMHDAFSLIFHIQHLQPVLLAR